MFVLCQGRLLSDGQYLSLHGESRHLSYLPGDPMLLARYLFWHLSRLSILRGETAMSFLGGLILWGVIILASIAFWHELMGAKDE